MSAVAGFDGREGEANVLTFRPVGPVASGFVNDRSMVSTIMGPYGSAKTTSAFQKIINMTLWQRPDRAGVRHSRGMVLRATYGQLQTNVMEDWFDWFPKTKENFNGETNNHDLRLEVQLPGGRSLPLHIQVLFRACDNEAKAEELLKGVNLTWAWLNEVDTLHESLKKFVLPRLGRYPGTREGGCAWSGIMADMNAPQVDNWTYDFLVEKNMGLSEEEEAALRQQFGDDFRISFHRQPGGLSAAAENLDNLPPGYYERLAATMSSNDKRRFVDNEFGAVRAGQPVYPEFIDRFHMADGPLTALADRGAVLAIDGGSTPAAVLLQIDDGGQVRVLDEVVVFSNSEQTVLEKMGPRGFAKMCREHLDRRWPKLRIDTVTGDPAIFYGEHGDDLAWSSEFGKVFGKRVRPAPVVGNRLTPRIEGVRACLTGNIGPHPGMLVSPRCAKLRQGFNAGYVLSRIKLSSGGGRWRDDPDKNDFSHVHDALQYGVAWVKKRGLASLDIENDRTRNLRERRGKVTLGKHQSGGGNVIHR